MIWVPSCDFRATVKLKNILRPPASTAPDTQAVGTFVHCQSVSVLLQRSLMYLCMFLAANNPLILPC